MLRYTAQEWHCRSTVHRNHHTTCCASCLFRQYRRRKKKKKNTNFSTNVPKRKQTNRGMQWKGELLRKFLQEFLATQRINWPLLLVAAAEAVVERHHRRLPCCDCLSDWLSVSWISKWSCSLLCGYARACVPYVCVVFCGEISFWPWIREFRSCQPEAWLVIGVGWARLRTVQKRDQSQSSNNSSQMVERKGSQGNWMMDVSMNEWMGWIRWAFSQGLPPYARLDGDAED